MISLKKYLDGAILAGPDPHEVEASDKYVAIIAAYGSSMQAMGKCILEICPSLGDKVKKRFGELQSDLSADMSAATIGKTDREIQKQLYEWGQHAADYYRKKTIEVKELLLAMARTAESVSQRDQNCASQMNEVTERLLRVATLDDVTEIRASIEKGVAEFKSSIEHMAAEGKAVVEELRREVTDYQLRLEEAEELALRDSLTGLCNRMCVESLIEERIAAGAEFCVAMLDIDGFKEVNDTHGHLAGDEVLKAFANEVRSDCRATDVIGRWGGDEFILLLDCDLAEARDRLDRLCQWVCGYYAVHIKGRELKLRVDASAGLADHRNHESLKTLIARADAAMYERKAAARAQKKLAMDLALPA